jgi:hypothetical protein
VFRTYPSFGNRHTAVCALSTVRVYGVEVATNWTECSDRPRSHLYSTALQRHILQTFGIIYLSWKLVSVNYVYTVEQKELCLHSRRVNYVYTVEQSKLCLHSRTE